MSVRPWRFAFASAVGKAHVDLGLPCQDAAECRILPMADGTPVLVAVVADGAGSASRSEVGAGLLCALMIDEIACLLESGGDVQQVTKGSVEEWLNRFHAEVARRAEAENLAPRDFACTALVAMVGIDCAMFAQIGDGAIVVSRRSESDEYVWVFWPQRGEYENLTYFATDATAHEHLQFEIVQDHVDEIALFSDGLQRLALHYESQTAHAPFFRPMFAPVRAAPEGHAEHLSAALVAFLSSRPVHDRTEDDTTLIIATRRGVEQNESRQDVPIDVNDATGVR